MTLQARTILILGLGESGLAMARWCAREGAVVRVADTRAQPPGRAALLAALPDADLRQGFDADLLDGIDLIGISPGLAPMQAPQHELLAQAAQRGIPVWGEIEFFAQKLAALKARQGYAPRVIAITGTNGKTTVTSLTGKLCARAGLRTAVAGNISPAALDALAAALDVAHAVASEVASEAVNEMAPEPEANAATDPNAALPQVWVLELSSFQLETALTFRPDAATVLNITQDHLDWHGGMDAYAAAKARIFAPGTVRVLNRGDARVVAMQDSTEAIMTFGTDAPQLADSFGIVTDGGMRWLAYAEAADTEGVRPGRRRQKNLVLEPAVVKRLMPVDALHIRGDHNAANALAALALARAIGLPIAPLLHALRDYRGEPHRVEQVLQLHGVDYVDDSKGTNVGATVAALDGLAGPGGKVLLIAGGAGKGQDFSPLAAPVARQARAVFLIGADAPALRAALAATGVALIDCDSLEQAVQQAAQRAERGDVVLLSPACASLDMFRDYKHRAAVFVDAVRELALEAGQPC